MLQCRMLTSFQEGLAGNRVRDRVQGCLFLKSFQEVVLTRKQFFSQNSESKMTNSIVVNIVKYLYSFTKTWC